MAAHAVMGFSGSDEGRRALHEAGAVEALIPLIADPVVTLAHDATASWVNMRKQ